MPCKDDKLIVINLPVSVKYLLLCVMQEGTLKKINKNRNEKTTRNTQEGLPFTIDDVKRQMEDPALLAAVSTVNLLAVCMQSVSVFVRSVSVCILPVSVCSRESSKASVLIDEH